ncbi:MAG: winged helix-turn-helix domain-containing protein [Anaerolineae bacterium]
MADKKGAAKGRKSRSPTILRAGDLRLNVKTHQVTTGDNTQRLTPLECKLLETFMRNRGRTLTHRFLIKEVWDTEFHGLKNSLQVHVCWLRRKIGDNVRSPKHIHTVHGIGYRFD